MWNRGFTPREKNGTIKGGYCGMKAYKNEIMNIKVRSLVREYRTKPFGLSAKYWTNGEWEDSLVKRFRISHGMAVKIREIVRADAYHDEIALKVWGFNKHTA